MVTKLYVGKWINWKLWKKWHYDSLGKSKWEKRMGNK